MSIITALLAVAAHPAVAPPCRAAQLRLSADGRDGEFDGMSHSGVELSLRNMGADCTIPALPTIGLRDRHDRRLPASAHRLPVARPVVIGGGHRAIIDLRWVSGNVFDHGRALHATTIFVRIGRKSLRTPWSATLYGPARQSVAVDQKPARTAEGMAAG